MKEIVNSKLRRPLSRNKTFNCAEIDVGGMLLLYKAQNRKSSPRWRGPTEVLDIDETGATVSFQSQNFKAARYCVRKQMKDSEVTESCGKFFSAPGYPWMGPRGGGNGLAPILPEAAPKDNAMGDGELPTESGGKSTDTTEEASIASPRLIPKPESPTNSGETAIPSIMEDSGKTSVSCDRQRASPQAPGRVSVDYEHLAYVQIRDLCKLRGHHEKGVKAVLKTRLEAMDAAASQSLKLDDNAIDTSSSVPGKRGRSLVEPTNIESSTEVVEGKRRC